MSNSGNILKFLIFLILNRIVQGWIIHFQTYRQEYNPAMVKFMNLKLVNITKHITGLNGSTMYRVDIDKFDIIFIITSTKRNGKPWTLLNVTVDGCDYLEKASRNNMNFPYVFLTELRTSNPDFPEKCPFKKDKEIFIRNFYINAKRIRIKFPETSFSCQVILKQRRQQVFNYVVTGVVKTGTN